MLPVQPIPNLPVASLNAPATLTDEIKEDLPDAIQYGNTTETEAFRTLDASILTRAFTGEKLQSSRTEIESLVQNRLYYVSTLENQVFHQFHLSEDGQTAQVQLTETWSVVIYSAETDACTGKILSHSAPQTIYLTKLNDEWRVSNIVFDNASQPPIVSCDN